MLPFFRKCWRLTEAFEEFKVNKSHRHIRVTYVKSVRQISGGVILIALSALSIIEYWTRHDHCYIKVISSANHQRLLLIIIQASRLSSLDSIADFLLQKFKHNIEWKRETKKKITIGIQVYDSRYWMSIAVRPKILIPWQCLPQPPMRAGHKIREDDFFIQLENSKKVRHFQNSCGSRNSVNIALT